MAYGQWSPLELREPDSARTHVQGLQRFGLSLEAISERACLSPSLLAALVYPGHQRWGAKITAETMYRLLAVTFDLDALPGTRHIAAAGTSRRLQALAVLGWPLSTLAAQLGVTPQAVASYRRRPTVSVETARTVRGLYDQTSMCTGPSTRSALAALRAGWVPPLAWDEDTIDDPDATPELDQELPSGLDEVAIWRACMGEATDLTDAERRHAASTLAGRGLNDSEIAERLEVCSRTVLRWRHSSSEAHLNGQETA